MSCGRLALSEDGAIKKALVYGTGTADRTGIAIDMAGYDSVLFIVIFDSVAAGATTSIKAQSDDNSSFTSAQDITGTAVTVAADDDDEIKYLDIVNPPEQYVRIYIDKDAVNATDESACAILYNGRKKRPISQTLTEAEGELHIAPTAGGTA